MGYIIKNMDENILRKIISWKYEGEYSEYNLDSYEKLKNRKSSLTLPEKSENYLCYFTENELIGYTNLVAKENGDLFLGIGLSPRYCSKGIGRVLLKDTIEKAKEKYKHGKIVLQVRSWNKRAISCYIKTGFDIVKTEYVIDHNGKENEFVFMKYEF